MNKTEFIEILRNTLTGEVDGSVVSENVQYYTQYIQSQMNQGRSEQEIMDELGDPRLIARTIIDTSAGGAYHNGSQSAYSEAYTDAGSSGSDTSGRQRGFQIHFGSSRNQSTFQMILNILLVVLVVITILVLAVNVLAFVLPIIIPIFIVLWIVRLFSGGSR